MSIDLSIINSNNPFLVQALPKEEINTDNNTDTNISASNPAIADFNPQNNLAKPLPGIEMREFSSEKGLDFDFESSSAYSQYLDDMGLSKRKQDVKSPDNTGTVSLNNKGNETAGTIAAASSSESAGTIAASSSPSTAGTIAAASNGSSATGTTA